MTVDRGPTTTTPWPTKTWSSPTPSASTGDYGLRCLSDQSITVTITEDDEAGVSIDPTGLTVVEGDATCVTYDGGAGPRSPPADVTVTISGHAGTDVTLVRHERSTRPTC